MRIGPHIVFAHLPKTGGTSIAAWLERNGHTYRQPGETWHVKERACLVHGVDPRSHLSLADLTPRAAANRELWVSLRDPVDWYPSVWAHLGRELGPLDANGAVVSLPWPRWLTWALARSSDPHPTPQGRCVRRESLLWWSWQRVQGGRVPTRVLWTHQLPSQLPGVERLNAAAEVEGTGRRLLPEVDAGQRRCIQGADWWVREVTGWDGRW